MSRPSYSQQENDAIRQQLIDGAMTLFRQHGQSNLTLRKLASHMNMSHTKLYRYFKNKDALLLSVKMMGLEILYDILIKNDPHDSDPLIRLRVASKSLHSFATHYKKEYLFLFLEINAQEETQAFIDMKHKVFNYIVDIAKLANAEGHTNMDGRTLANLSWATFHGLFLLHFSGQLIEGRSFETLLESAINVLFQAKL